jgi:hypothetical protein
MPSIPQAFFNFMEFNNFCKSHGRILSGGGVLVYSFQQSLDFSPEGFETALFQNGCLAFRLD